MISNDEILCDVCEEPAATSAEGKDYCAGHYLEYISPGVDMLPFQIDLIKEARLKEEFSFEKKRKGKTSSEEVCSYCGHLERHHPYGADGRWKLKDGQIFFGDCYARYASSLVNKANEDRRTQKKLSHIQDYFSEDYYHGN